MTLNRTGFSPAKVVLCLFFSSFWLVLNAQGTDAFSTKLSKENHFDYAFPTNNGLFKVRENGQYTFVDSTGKIAKGWQWFDFIGNFWEGIAPVRLGDRWGICNADGQVTIPLSLDTVSLDYKHQLVWFKENGMWGMANGASSKIIFWEKCEYYQRLNFESPLIWLIKKEEGNGIIDTAGKWIVPPVYDWINASYSNTVPLIPFMRLDKMGFMDTSGWEIIVPTLDYDMYKYDLSFVKKKLWALQNGLWGLINSKGQWLIPPIFKQVSGKSNVGAWVSSESGLWGFVDTNGTYLVPPMPLDEPPYQKFENGSVIVKQNGKYGLLGIGGKWKIPPRSEPIKYGINNLFLLDNPGKNSICTDDKGNIVIPESKIYSSGECLYIFRKGAWSFVNSSGKWIKKPKLDSIVGFRSGIAFAKMKGKWGLLSDNGKWLIPPQYDSAFLGKKRYFNDSNYELLSVMPIVLNMDGEVIEQPKTNQLFWLKKNKTWYLTDTSGHFFPKIASASAREVKVICKDVFAMATTDNLWQVYKQDGSLLFETQFEEVSITGEAGSHFSVKLNGKWGIMAKNGNLEFPCISDDSIRYMNLWDGRTIIECYSESFWVNKKCQLGVNYEKK